MRQRTSTLDAVIKGAIAATSLAFATGAIAQQAGGLGQPGVDQDQTPQSTTERPSQEAGRTEMPDSRATGAAEPTRQPSATSPSQAPATRTNEGMRSEDSATRGTAGSGMAEGAGSAASTPGTRSAAGSSDADSPDAVWVRVPVALSARSQQMADGCWVQLYSGDNFKGSAMTVVGPTSIAEVRSPYGTGLNNWESAVVGPNAAVTTYDGKNFSDRSASLRAGQRYADLGDNQLGLFEDIESMRVTCTGQAGQASGSGQSGSSGTATPQTDR